MSKEFKKHVFVCENVRDSFRGKSCGGIGAPLRIELKSEMFRRKLNDKIKINKSGCLGKCSQGACIVIYPQGKWCFNVKLEECKEIANQLVTE